jgi:NitT/TauT family transport system ATP-binding protein
MSVSRRLLSAKSETTPKLGQKHVESDPADTAKPLGESVLSLDQIGQVFVKGSERLVALERVHLDIGPGEFVSLVGPSGCGKSTLLKIIAGLLQPTVGTVRFEGSAVTSPRDEIGLMFQTPTLFPWRTTIRNITLPLEIRKATGFDWEQRVAEVIDLVRLNGFENHYPRELSGGMQQRVALSRLLVSDPHLMLLDEPFGALDEFTREHLNTELARISDHENKTTVFVTHNIAEAVFLSDRVVVMGTRPGCVLDAVDVPIPRPRLGASRRNPAYNETINRIRETLDLS